ncbi:hypothetical protein [Streptomyces koyangensis]
MTEQLWIGLVAVVGSMCLGYVLGGAAAIRRRDRDLDVLRNQVEAQLRFADQQSRSQRAAERERHHQERAEEAYAALARWLYDLGRTIEEVWAGAHAADEDIREKAVLIVRRWPWETLVVPEQASGAQLYWSSEVRALTRKFSGASARFVNQATSALSHAEDQGADLQEVRGRLWDSCEDMHGILSELWDQARRDLRAG